MLIMAKAYFKLGKNEWVKTLGDMMKNAGASEAERADVYQMLAFMEIDKQNTPGAIEMMKKATSARPDSAQLWNNLGAQYLVAKNYRGVKEYEKAQAEYQRALQLFPRYADAIFNLGILYLDAEKMPNLDVVARLNGAIAYLQQYKQMVTGAGQTVGPEADAYIQEAQDGIRKEQKRIERQKKQEERDQQRAAKKAADDAKKAPPAAAPARAPQPAAPYYPAPAAPVRSTLPPASAVPPAAPSYPAPAAYPAPAGYPAPAAPVRSAPPAASPYQWAPAPAAPAVPASPAPRRTP
jgi:Tfp pilus assembly protein PilF